MLTASSGLGVKYRNPPYKGGGATGGSYALQRGTTGGSYALQRGTTWGAIVTFLSKAGVIFDRDALRNRGLVWNGKNLLYNPVNVFKARKLRKEMTPQERKLWQSFLRTYPIRFIRQRPVDHYILDFYCASRKIAIEIDGQQHSSSSGEEYDRQRSDILSIYKIRVIRFSNHEIDNQFEAVCQRICKEIPL